MKIKKNMLIGIGLIIFAWIIAMVHTIGFYIAESTYDLSHGYSISNAFICMLFMGISLSGAGWLIIGKKG